MVASEASTLVNLTSDLARSELMSKVEYTVSDEESEPSSDSGGNLVQDLKRRAAKFHLRRKSSPVKQGMAVTGLTSLSSQYVGPIGVGTIVAPDRCQPRKNDALEFLHRDVEDKRRAACHLEDESQVWVVFDTGSTNIWVASDLCRYGACVKKGRHRYNHTRSQTYDWPSNGLELTVQFGTGCIKGPQAKDDFHIGPFTVFNQTFGMIETQNGSVFSEVPFEGILGLAFSSMSANGVTPFFDSIIQQQALVHNEFAFYFSPDSVTANAIFWGGVDPSFFEGPIQYYPVIDPYYWAVELVSFKIGNRELRPEGLAQGSDSLLEDEEDADLEADQDAEELANDDPQLDQSGLRSSPIELRKTDASKPWAAIVDTGTTFFTAEGDMYEEIMSMLQPVTCSEMTDQTHPPITYRLRSTNGKAVDFVLHNHQYMTSGSSDPDAECTAAFMRIDIPPEHGPAMVLGECFLRHYYAVFDRADGDAKHARVGFAKSRHDDQPVNQLMHLTRGQQYFQMPANESDVEA